MISNNLKTAKLTPLADAAASLVITKADGATSVCSFNTSTSVATLAAVPSLPSQTAKYVLAAPNAADGVPSFRALVASDIPSLSYEPANSNIQSHISSTSNPHAVTKSQLGLGVVTNDVQVKAITSTDNAIVRFDSTDGQVQNSVVTVDDTGNVNIPANMTYNCGGSVHTHTGVYEPAFGALSYSKLPNSGTRTWAAGGDMSITGGNISLNTLRINGSDYDNTIWQSNADQNLGITLNSTSASKYIRLGTSGNSTAGLFVTGAGNVGIGTSAPKGMLSVGDYTTLATGAGGASTQTILSRNTYYDGSNWKYLYTNYGTLMSFDSGGNINFYTAPSGTAGDSANYTNRMTILNGGNVGIGNISPSHPLVVGSGTTNSCNTAFKVIATDSSGAAIGAVVNNKAIYLYNDGNTTFKLDAYNYTTNAALNFSLATNGGNVGIGCTPITPCHIYGNYNSSGSTTTNCATLFLDSAAGKDTWLGFGMAGSCKHVIGLDDGSTTLSFWGYDSDWHNSLNVTNGGLVGIGCTPDNRLHVFRSSAGTVSSHSNAVITLESDATGYMQFLQPANGVGGIVFGDPDGIGQGQLYYNHTSEELCAVAGGSNGVKLTSGATAWASLSDRRFKKQITPMMNDALPKIALLKPSFFRYTEDSDDRQRRVGLIAQDVQLAVPEAVHEDKDGILSYRPTELIPLLVKAIQEQQAQIEDLRKRIQQLNAAK